MNSFTFYLYHLLGCRWIKVKVKDFGLTYDDDAAADDDDDVVCDADNLQVTAESTRQGQDTLGVIALDSIGNISAGLCCA